MEISCSFKTLVVRVCGFDRRDRTQTGQVIPILSCQRDIESHQSTWKLSGFENEVDLLFCRAGKFRKPENIQDLSICPKHRSELGTGWTRGGNTRCRIPNEISGHKKGKLPKGDRGVNKDISQQIFKRTGRLIQVGSGVCTNCEKMFNQPKVQDLTSDFEDLRMEEEDFEVTFKPFEATTPVASSSLLQSTPGSQYQPADESCSFVEPVKPESPQENN